jgi:hypothetical protein
MELRDWQAEMHTAEPRPIEDEIAIDELKRCK